MTAAEPQFSAHEACVVMLTERIDEMRDHLDQARLRPQAAESQIQAGGTTGGHVKFTLTKEMMPDSFYRYGSHEVLRLGDRGCSNFLGAGDYEHRGSPY